MSSEYKELRDLIIEQDLTAAVNVAVVTGKLDVAAEDREKMRNDITSIRKTVNGNGEDGLVGRVGKIESWRVSLEKGAKWIGGIIGTILAGTILAILLG
jgi:hypothetical protein